MKKLILMIPNLIMLSSIVLAHGEEEELGHHMMTSGMMNWMYGGFGMGFFGWLISILIIVLLVLLIFWLIKQIQKK